MDYEIMNACTKIEALEKSITDLQGQMSSLRENNQMLNKKLNAFIERMTYAKQ